MYDDTTPENREEKRSSPELRINRRGFLRSTGAAGAAGLVGSSGVTAVQGRDRTADGIDLDPLEGLSYEYYEGAWPRYDWPPFARTESTTSGPAPANLISLAPRQRDQNYAFVYEGTITVGHELDPGEYTFVVTYGNSDLRLYVDDQLVIDSTAATQDKAVDDPQGTVASNDPNNPGDERSSVRLEEGDHRFRLEFVYGSGDHTLEVGWRGPYDELLPRIAVDDPLRSGQEYDFEIRVRDRPASKRLSMPDSAYGSISVGIPANTNFCFDTTTGVVQYGWRGAFLDFGPAANYGNGRENNNDGNILGTRFTVGAVDYPLRFGNQNEQPTVEFNSHETSYPPEVSYSVDGTPVTQTVEPVSGDNGLEYTFRIEESHDQSVYFLTDSGANIERSSSKGSWNGGVLELPEGTTEFTVTIVSTEITLPADTPVDSPADPPVDAPADAAGDDASTSPDATDADGGAFSTDPTDEGETLSTNTTDALEGGDEL